MSDTLLLCTFTKTYKLAVTLEEVRKKYGSQMYGKIFILQDVDNPDVVFCTYNVNGRSMEHLNNTISINRKKDTNTLYTINALNHIVALHNGGKIDTSFTAPWEEYKDCLLTIDNDDLKIINTKLYDIIDV